MEFNTIAEELGCSKARSYPAIAERHAIDIGSGSALSLSHRLIGRCVSARSVVVDATAGNGHDTLFLASLVSPGGTVHAFDVQMKALHRTEERLREKGVRDGTVILHHIGHEFAAATLAAAGVIAIRAAMFNLGYLPRGDPAIITQPNTTIRAVADMLSLLDSQGIITLVMYVGHPGGESEAAALRAFIQQIPTSEFMARHYRPAPHRDHSPELIVIERLDGTCGT